MENFETNDIIEKYLEGSLSPAERAAVEDRIATDPSFRAELELHRQLQAEFADPQKLQLRNMLQDIVNEPLPTPSKNNGFKRWALGLLILLTLGALWMYWNSTSASPESKPGIPSAPSSGNPPQDNAPVDPVDKQTPAPIAMNTGPRFATNRDFESRLGDGNVRSTANTGIEMKSPVQGARLALENGKVNIQFKGLVGADADTAQYPLVLKIFNNVPNTAPLFELRPVIAQKSADPWLFSSRAAKNLSPGLYYFTLERAAEEELLWVGKFIVVANN